MSNAFRVFDKVAWPIIVCLIFVLLYSLYHPTINSPWFAILGGITIILTLVDILWGTYAEVQNEKATNQEQ